ncbi:MAG: hypothetical protein ABJA34_12745 [Pseudonocardiales bacterium]
MPVRTVTRPGSAAVPTTGAIGSVVAATLTSLCCAGQLGYLLLGAGGAVAAAQLAPARPYLLALAAVSLAADFGSAFRRRTCRARPGLIAKVTLWLAASILLASIVVPWWVR